MMAAATATTAAAPFTFVGRRFFDTRCFVWSRLWAGLIGLCLRLEITIKSVPIVIFRTGMTFSKKNKRNKTHSFQSTLIKFELTSYPFDRIASVECLPIDNFRQSYCRSRLVVMINWPHSIGSNPFCPFHWSRKRVERNFWLGLNLNWYFWLKVGKVESGRV